MACTHTVRSIDQLAVALTQAARRRLDPAHEDRVHRRGSDPEALAGLPRRVRRRRSEDGEAYGPQPLAPRAGQGGGAMTRAAGSARRGSSRRRGTASPADRWAHGPVPGSRRAGRRRVPTALNVSRRGLHQARARGCVDDEQFRAPPRCRARPSGVSDARPPLPGRVLVSDTARALRRMLYERRPRADGVDWVAHRSATTRPADRLLAAGEPLRARAGPTCLSRRRPRARGGRGAPPRCRARGRPSFPHATHGNGSGAKRLRKSETDIYLSNATLCGGDRAYIVRSASGRGRDLRHRPETPPRSSPGTRASREDRRRLLEADRPSAAVNECGLTAATRPGLVAQVRWTLVKRT